MKNKSPKAIYLTVLSLLILLFMFISYNFIIRCPAGGYTEEKAVEIANKYIPIHFSGTFTLTHRSFNKDEKEWNFSYVQNDVDCTVDCLVDRCGVFDVVGVTKGCKSLP